MKTICSPRCSGKTTRLIYESNFSGMPILCNTELNKQYIEDKAKELRLVIPQPIVLSSVIDGDYKTYTKTNVLVDDAEYVLSALLSAYGMSAKAMTVTDDSADLEKLYGIEK